MGEFEQWDIVAVEEELDGVPTEYIAYVERVIDGGYVVWYAVDHLEYRDVVTGEQLRLVVSREEVLAE